MVIVEGPGRTVAKAPTDHRLLKELEWPVVHYSVSVFDSFTRTCR